MDLLGGSISRPKRWGVRAILMATTLTSSCALFHREPPADEARTGTTSQRSPTGRSTERTTAALPGEQREPPRGDTGAGSPRRIASDRLVEEGKGYLIAGRDAEARERFQRAVRLDGSNGVAYLYLAELAADGGEWSDAAGYHAQAEALLNGREDYRPALDDLAMRIARQR